MPNPLRVSWLTCELPAFRFLHQLKRAPLLDVFDLQLFQPRRDLRFVHLCKLVRQKFVARARALDRALQLARGQRFLRAE